MRLGLQVLEGLEARQQAQQPKLAKVFEAPPQARAAFSFGFFPQTGATAA